VKISQQVSLALLVGASLGTGLAGCKSPLGGLAFWNKDEGSIASSSPDVGREKYSGLAKEFGGKQGSVGLGGQAPASNEGFLASSWNKTTSAVSSVFRPKVETDDPTKLDSKTGKIGAEPFIAAGRLLENQNKLPEAQRKYEDALKASPNDLTALVSLARLHDRQGNAREAVALYQQAIKAHPRTALVHNDLGLCYARQQQWQRATECLNSAISLQPANAKYRNNMATVMIEMGRTQDAYKQLAAVNSEAVAHYNLAWLLSQKGMKDQAITHLRQALAKDATLGPAHEMLAELAGAPAAPAGAQPETRIAAQPISTPLQQSPVQQSPVQQSPTQQQPQAAPITEPAPQASVYGGGGQYSISDDVGPIPGAATTPAYGGNTEWGSEADASPAPVSGIEPLPPLEE
jgi:tetratricopeptide (TPR) repeat protein